MLFLNQHKKIQIQIHTLFIVDFIFFFKSHVTLVGHMICAEIAIGVEAHWVTDHCMTRHWHSITILQYAFEELSIQIS